MKGFHSHSKDTRLTACKDGSILISCIGNEKAFGQSDALNPQEADRLIAWLIEARGHRLVHHRIYESVLASLQNTTVNSIDEESKRAVSVTMSALRGENE